MILCSTPHCFLGVVISALCISACVIIHRCMADTWKWRQAYTYLVCMSGIHSAKCISVACSVSAEFLRPAWVVVRWNKLLKSPTTNNGCADHKAREPEGLVIIWHSDATPASLWANNNESGLGDYGCLTDISAPVIQENMNHWCSAALYHNYKSYFNTSLSLSLCPCVLTFL